MTFPFKSMEAYEVEVAKAHEALADTSWVHPIHLRKQAKPTQARFEEVGERLREQFIIHSKVGSWMHREHEGSLMSGFLVIARGLERCRSAYQHHLTTTDTPDSTSECLAALKHPRTARFITSLAGMQIGKNRELEMWLGLRGVRALDEETFVFVPEPAGHFAPEPTLYAHATAEMQRWALRNGQSTEARDDAPHRCPFGIFIPTLWRIAAGAAAEVHLLDFQTADERQVVD